MVESAVNWRIPCMVGVGNVQAFFTCWKNGWTLYHDWYWVPHFYYITVMHLQSDHLNLLSFIKLTEWNMTQNVS